MTMTETKTENKPIEFTIGGVDYQLPKDVGPFTQHVNGVITGLKDKNKRLQAKNKQLLACLCAADQALKENQENATHGVWTRHDFLTWCWSHGIYVGPKPETYVLLETLLESHAPITNKQLLMAKELMLSKTPYPNAGFLIVLLQDILTAFGTQQAPNEPGGNGSRRAALQP